MQMMASDVLSAKLADPRNSKPETAATAAFSQHSRSEARKRYIKPAQIDTADRLGMDQKDLLLFKRVDNFSSSGLTTTSGVGSGHRSSTQVGHLARYLDRHRSRSKAGKSSK